MRHFSTVLGIKKFAQCSFIENTLIECLLCAKPCAGCLGYQEKSRSVISRQLQSDEDLSLQTVAVE